MSTALLAGHFTNTYNGIWVQSRYTPFLQTNTIARKPKSFPVTQTLAYQCYNSRMHGSTTHYAFILQLKLEHLLLLHLLLIPSLLLPLVLSGKAPGSATSVTWCSGDTRNWQAPGSTVAIRAGDHTPLYWLRTCSHTPSIEWVFKLNTIQCLHVVNHWVKWIMCYWQNMVCDKKWEDDLNYFWQKFSWPNDTIWK
jgi:hypothetical protein